MLKVIPEFLKPSPAINLSAFALSYSAITLTWNSVDGANSYNIYMGTTQNSMDKMDPSLKNENPEKPKEPIIEGPPTPQPTPQIIYTTANATFVADYPDLMPDVHNWLDSIANDVLNELTQNPDKTVEITGYCAIFPGLPEPNALSLERAEKIKEELVKRGIPANRMKTLAGGETAQFGNTRDGNRRIMIIIQ